MTENIDDIFLNFPHMQECDMCTLTWSDDFCDDFKQWLSDKTVILERYYSGYEEWAITHIAKVDDNQIGLITTLQDTDIILLRKYAKEVKYEEEMTND